MFAQPTETLNPVSAVWTIASSNPKDKRILLKSYPIWQQSNLWTYNSIMKSSNQLALNSTWVDTPLNEFSIFATPTPSHRTTS